MLSIEQLLQRYRDSDLKPRTWLSERLEQARNDTHNAWIQVLSSEQLEQFLARLDQHSPDSLPLYGVPFAIKDNIDLAAVPTTAACPEFAYTPSVSAPVVQALVDAGAVPLGKTNMDQFATGLVGTRSPWGPCRNSLNADYISGGSSAGSAVAVALGQVAFSLGTDTAGSGRVPAAFNNIVGLKPSRGLLSTRGVVPACASLDCVTIFAQNCEDANTVLNVATQFDAQDIWSRPNPYGNGKRYFKPERSAFRFGLPRPEQCEFFADDKAASEFEQACQALRDIGGEPVAMDFTPLLSAAQLLYKGPWVAERYLAVQPLIESQPDALLPVIREIIAPGEQLTALQTFSAQYQLQAFRQQAQSLLDQVDFLVTPTAGTCYTIDALDADPIALNSNLGYYTNFMNLLDYAAVAVPTGFLNSGVGTGITLFHQAFSDKRLLSLAATLQEHLALAPGAQTQHPTQADKTFTGKNTGYGAVPEKTVSVVVCGAHLQGLPLNWQLLERGGRLLETTRSAETYRLYALAGGPPFRPGLVRNESSPTSIEVEVWQLPIENFGSFVAEIPPPLGIGKVQLADGRCLPGFICEPSGLEGAEDITEFGGWRPYMKHIS